MGADIVNFQHPDPEPSDHGDCMGMSENMVVTGIPKASHNQCRGRDIDCGRLLGELFTLLQESPKHLAG